MQYSLFCTLFIYTYQSCKWINLVRWGLQMYSYAFVMWLWLLRNVAMMLLERCLNIYSEDWQNLSSVKNTSTHNTLSYSLHVRDWMRENSHASFWAREALILIPHSPVSDFALYSRRKSRRFYVFCNFVDQISSFSFSEVVHLIQKSFHSVCFCSEKGFGKSRLPYYISTYPHTAFHLPVQAPPPHTHLYMQQPVGS